MKAPGIARLTGVELRKMTDTRAGFWLQFVVVALTIALVVAFSIFAETKDLTYENMLLITVQPAGFLLPVIGILLVSSEWSQRTALITFTLVPKRWRILLAKLLAAITLALAAMVISVPVAALATAIAGGSWDIARRDRVAAGRVPHDRDRDGRRRSAPPSSPPPRRSSATSRSRSRGRSSAR